MSDKRPVVMFDLGGVLADQGKPAEAMGLDMTDEEFWNLWLSSAAVQAYELGNLTTERFCAAFTDEVQNLNGRFTPARFRQWTLRLFPEADGLVRALAHQHRLALLSNTNEVHWDQVTAGCQTFCRFSEVFLSFDTGLYKPSRAAFLHAVDVLHCRPADVLYFDDSERNVESARSVGIDAHHVRGMVQLEDAIADRFGL